MFKVHNCQHPNILKKKGRHGYQGIKPKEPPKNAIQLSKSIALTQGPPRSGLVQMLIYSKKQKFSEHLLRKAFFS